MAPCHGWGGLRKEKVHLAVLRENYWSLPSWKAAKENGLVSGVNIVVWGLQWGSPGSQLANTWPLATGEVGWEKKRCIWQFQESITGCYQKTKNSFFSKKSPLAKTTFLKTGSAKRAKYCVFWPEIVFHTYIVNFLPKFWGRDTIFMSVFGLCC